MLRIPNCTFLLGVIYLLVLPLYVSALKANEKWRTYDTQDPNWPLFQYPSDYVINKSSRKGEGLKWVVVLVNEHKKSEIRVSNYGFIAESEGVTKGFDNARDYALVSMLKNSKRILRDDFEVFIVKKDQDKLNTYIKVVFLDKNPTWGSCYKWMSFIYPKSEEKEMNTIVNKMVDSFHFKKSKQ